MNIITMKIKDIIPYEKNAKKHNRQQIQNVAESIKRFGFAQPLVVDKDNVLIIGHCRLLASKLLQIREVPVVRMDDLTEEQVKELRLLDNKLNESEWDMDLLAEELQGLDMEGFDIDWELPEEEPELRNVFPLPCSLREWNKTARRAIRRNVRRQFGFPQYGHATALI